MISLATAYNLGVSSLFRVGCYRIALKLGIHPVLSIKHAVPRPPFFRKPTAPVNPGLVPRTDWDTIGHLFFYHQYPISSRPAWFRNYLSGSASHAHQPWYGYGDFDENLGDIKTLWDLSRFDWLISLAQRAAKGDDAELYRLNDWLLDWCISNPPYQGPNWKCGQEASIRVIHLILAASILKQCSAPDNGLVDLVAAHLKRIAPTIGYAVGQNNNHGTSEAAALFMGGSFLKALGNESGASWESSGRYWLENRVDALVATDGTFSQYSTVYHRMFLSTISIVVWWQRRSGLSEFSGSFLEKGRKATLWMSSLTDSLTGDCPNYGANDGSLICKLSDHDYRDFRPAVQIAANLFLEKSVFPGIGHADLRWLELPLKEPMTDATFSQSFDKGGIHLMQIGTSKVVFRYPRFKFRPSHADALHVDLWKNGRNLLRDSGTYSYNSASPLSGILQTAQAHNTITFDQRDQMPKEGRFLYGKWLKSQDVSTVREWGQSGLEASAGYVDRFGNKHVRSVVLENGKMTCTDRVSGPFKSAILTWRLNPSDIVVTENQFENDFMRGSIVIDDKPASLRNTWGDESRYYFSSNRIPVIECDIVKPATITTTVEF